MTFFFQADTTRVIILKILTLPSFIMAVNSTLFFEAQIRSSIHHKSNPYGSMGLIKAF